MINLDRLVLKTRYRILIYTCSSIFILFPFTALFHFNMSNEVMVDGITVSAFVVWIITVVLSLVTWFLFSWASKNIREVGILLSTITGIVLVLPLVQIIGPMAAIVLGILAGFIAFMIQKYLIKHSDSNVKN